MIQKFFLLLILLAMESWLLMTVNAITKKKKNYFLKVFISDRFYLLAMVVFVANNFRYIFNRISDGSLSLLIVVYKKLI